MTEVTWTVTTPSGEVKRSSGNPKIEHYPAYAIDEKTPKGQVLGAKRFNAMRQRLLDLGEMESK